MPNPLYTNILKKYIHDSKTQLVDNIHFFTPLNGFNYCYIPVTN